MVGTIIHLRFKWWWRPLRRIGIWLGKPEWIARLCATKGYTAVHGGWHR